MNKKGNTSPMLVVGGIIVIIILGIIAYGVSQSTFGTSTTNIPGADCSQTPTIAVSAVKALDEGTSVTPGVMARVNGVFIGTITSSTKFTVGDNVELLLNATDYLDEKLPAFKVGCDVNRVPSKLYATDDMTISIKNDAGTSVLTDNAAGGSINESAFAAGGSKTFAVEITGKDKQSSGGLIYVVELGVEANISSVTMSDSSGAAMEKLSGVPTGLTTSGTNQYRVAFRLPSVQNAVKKTFFLNVALNSAKQISGAVYTTAYSEQAYVDTDGSFKVGVVDSAGTVKYEDDFDYDFLLS